MNRAHRSDEPNCFGGARWIGTLVFHPEQPMRTSLEVVPRSGAALAAAVALVARRYPGIDTVNLPDLANCELDSMAAAAAVAGHVRHRIPHLRARDLNSDTANEIAARLAQHAIDEVIVVAGDARGDGANEGLTPTQLIAHLARALPNLCVYAAIDGHRYGDDAALADNIAGKIAAGAKGFFTQPLFCLRDLDRIAPLLQGASVFWGLSPVISAASRRYWERVNQVVFPAEFEASLQWNQGFALRLLTEAARRSDNAYLMPIKVDIETYLAPLHTRLSSRR
jgi:methylenetetrahydrofolate reductase (NADPH)